MRPHSGRALYPPHIVGRGGGGGGKETCLDDPHLPFPTLGFHVGATGPTHSHTCAPQPGVEGSNVAAPQRTC